jgi:hypothetical protein
MFKTEARGRRLGSSLQILCLSLAFGEGNSQFSLRNKRDILQSLHELIFSLSLSHISKGK